METMGVRAIARAVGLSPSHVSRVLSGRRKSRRLMRELQELGYLQEAKEAIMEEKAKNGKANGSLRLLPGVEMTRYRAGDRVRLLAKNLASDRNSRHVYEIEVTREFRDGGFIARFLIDGLSRFRLIGSSLARVEKCAFSAAKRYLAENARKRRARKAIKTEEAAE